MKIRLDAKETPGYQQITFCVRFCVLIEIFMQRRGFKRFSPITPDNPGSLGYGLLKRGVIIYHIHTKREKCCSRYFVLEVIKNRKEN
jgi:hypothetical protein